jgi:SAM-dependent MidA family methyltransferase
LLIANCSDVIRERGAMTVAAFMDLALYHPELGYYARAARRSGRAGDFFTSVDVGPLFGELLARQLAEMAAIVGGPFDLVEAGAGNGRLAADILQAARRHHPTFYEAVRLHLVERSPAAREAHTATLGDVAERLAHSSATLPDAFTGALVANELLDALPTHQVVMRDDGLREVYVAASSSSQLSSFRGGSEALQLIEGPPSTPELQAYLDRAGVALEPGWRVEINLRAVDWVRDAARRLTRGFLVLIDYGHEARELYSVTHADGTLTSFSGHRSEGPGGARPAWLQRPGEQDITAHVDFTSVRAAAEAEGLTTIGFLDQTYFLLGLLGLRGDLGSLGSPGSQGARGSLGSQGARGSLGSQGARGSLGSLGARGSLGSLGGPGSQGSQGLQGDLGSQGSPGSQGARGSLGSQGARGSLGSLGSPGSLGSLGAPENPENLKNAENPENLKNRENLANLKNPEHLANPANLANLKSPEHLANPANLTNQLKTLVLPGSLGSTHKVLILGRDVGTPALGGCSFRVRAT